MSAEEAEAKAKISLSVAGAVALATPLWGWRRSEALPIDWDLPPRPFEPGDRVWTPLFGWGWVTSWPGKGGLLFQVTYDEPRWLDDLIAAFGGSVLPQFKHRHLFHAGEPGVPKDPSAN